MEWAMVFIGRRGQTETPDQLIRVRSVALSHSCSFLVDLLIADARFVSFGSVVWLGMLVFNAPILESIRSRDPDIV